MPAPAAVRNLIYQMCTYSMRFNSIRTLAPQGRCENRGSRQRFDDKRLNIGVSGQLRPVLKPTRRAQCVDCRSGCTGVRKDKLHVLYVFEGRRSWPKLRHFKHAKHIEDLVRFRFRDRIWASLARGFRAICVDNMSDTSGSILRKYLPNLSKMTEMYGGFLSLY